jgi:hypothetical protein
MSSKSASAFAFGALEESSTGAGAPRNATLEILITFEIKQLSL